MGVNYGLDEGRYSSSHTQSLPSALKTLPTHETASLQLFGHIGNINTFKAN